MPFLDYAFFWLENKEKKSKRVLFCSGCAVAPRSSTTETLREDCYPKFKNSWFVSHFIGLIAIALSPFIFTLDLVKV